MPTRPSPARQRRSAAMDVAHAEALGLRALAHLLEDARLGETFMRLSGTEPDALAALAREPAFLAGVLEFIHAEDARIADFAAAAEIDPTLIGRAITTLVPKDEPPS